MQKIKNIKNEVVKHFYKLLHCKNYRLQNKSCVIIGAELIKIVSRYIAIKSILLGQDNSKFVAEKKYLILPQAMRKLSSLYKINEMIAEVTLPPYQDLSNKKRILILDRLRNPGNIGTLIRSAYAMGFEGVHLTKGSSSPFTPKGIKSSRGLCFSLPMGYGSIDFAGNMYSAVAGGNMIADVKMKEPLAIVLGNEIRGISKEIQDRSTCFGIPMEKDFDSINVAAAGAISLYHAAQNISCNN